MIYDSETSAIQQFDLSLQGQKPITREPAGFGESFLQQLGSFWREDQSTSRLFALSNAQGERARKIREVAGDKAFIKALTLSGDPSTTQMIEEIAAKHESVKTDAGLMGEIKERNTALRKERDAALEHQTTGGKIGGFLGVAAGAITDPLNLATLPLGASWATGILKTAAIEAGIAMATEAAIQPAIYRYKKELESPYDLKDVLINIGGAGVGAGVLTGGVKATARAIGRFGRFNAEVAPRRVDGFDDILETVQKLEDDAFTLGKPGEVPEGPRFTLNDEQRAAREVLQEHANTLRQSPFEAVPELDNIHLDALTKATDDIEAGRPVDVSEFIEQPGERVRIVKEAPAPRIPRESQSLGEYIRNSGGISVDRAGALRGEYEALLESGGRKSGTVKLKAGLSPDELAQRAHEAGFIDDADPYLLKEALERDLSGDKVYSFNSDRFERKLELSIEREMDDFDRIMEETFEEEAGRITQGRQVGKILEAEDMKIALDDGTTRSAREVIGELDADAKAAAAVKSCLAG